MDVARSDSFQELQDWLDTAGVVVLVGPPGIGKSTLAARVEPHVWVAVEGCRTPDELRDALARALEAPSVRDEAICHALGSSSAVVLDGLDLEADDVEPLLTSWSRHGHLVTTSCRHLSGRFPHVEVAPLTPAEGAALLRARLPDRHRAEGLDEDELQALSEALDGVPLALELVADRLRLHDPDVLRARALEDLTTQGPLASAIRQSIEALGAAARQLLATASALPGSFDAATLQAVNDGPVDHAMLELLDASLLCPLGGSPPRFWVLSPIRAAATGTTSDASLETIRERLAAHVLPSAEAAAERGDVAGLVELGQIQPTLEALLRSSDRDTRLRAALALSARERRTGPARATLDRDEVLPPGEGATALQVAWGLRVAGAACGALEPAKAEAVLTRLEPWIDDATRPQWLAANAFLLLIRRDARGSAALAEQALELRPDPSFAFRLGVARFELDEQVAAAAAFQQARLAADPFSRGHATYGLCTALMEQQVDAKEILEVVEEGEADGVDDYPWLACRFQFLRGALMADLGQLRASQAHYQAAADLHEALGEVPSQVAMWINARVLDFALGQVPTDLLQRPPAPPPESIMRILRVWQAVVHAALGHHAAAESLGVPALAALSEHTRMHDQLAAMLAVALDGSNPELATTLLPSGGPLADLARRALEGGTVDPGPHGYQRILAGVWSLTRSQAVVAEDGSAFVTTTGERVDISGRRVLRRILATLASSEGALDVQEICSQVWPGQRLVGQSGTRRVHVAISTLRSLGLRTAIETLSDGDHTVWKLIAVRREFV